MRPFLTGLQVPFLYRIPFEPQEGLESGSLQAFLQICGAFFQDGFTILPVCFQTYTSGIANGKEEPEILFVIASILGKGSQAAYRMGNVAVPKERHSRF